MPTQRVDDFLAHYSSQYYDPAKARAYYLKNRQLKGREAAKSPEERARDGRQNEAIRYANKQIGTKKTAELKKASTSQQARLEKLRQSAEEARARIVARLENLSDELQKETPIPANASPKLRAFLEKQHALRSKQIRKGLAKDMKKVAEDLRGALTKARSDYQTARQGLVEKYATAKVTEETNIRKNIN